MLTIFICINLFVGRGLKQVADARRIVVLFQFLSVAPLFILGVDFGRWIFLWIGSSALLYGFISCTSIVDVNAFSTGRAAVLVSKLAPGVDLYGPFRFALLALGIPYSCWSIQNFLTSTPIVYAFVNLRFLLGMLRQLFLNFFGLHA